MTTRTDRFGNAFAPGAPYARGAIVRSTADDLQKLAVAWRHIKERTERNGADSVYIMNGLERSMKVAPEEMALLDDELAPALLSDELRRLGVEHLGGDSKRHDVMVTNRMTAALLVAGDVMVEQGSVVIGVSPRYSHPAVTRAVAHGRGVFTDCAGVDEFRSAMAANPKVGLVVLTRLSVSYEILMQRDLEEIVRITKARGVRLLIDDAGGARVGPAIFGQPRSLELGAEVACTGLDKYGTFGPRLGLAGGDKQTIARMRARAFEMGLEARPMLYPAVLKTLRGYSPQRLRDTVEATQRVRDALIKRLGKERLWITDVIVQLRGEDTLEMAMQRAGLKTPPCVPFEATAGLSMILLRDFGVLTVHFAGIPTGTSALMFKFFAPETLERFGGADRLAEAIDTSITRLSEIIGRPDEYRKLLLGPEAVAAASAAA
jgi:L-seryl-tRNA(Ser) seleniumtransferase